jgi:hypothetical protein
MSKSFLVFEKAQHELAIDTVHILRILEEQPESSVSLDPLFASDLLITDHHHFLLLTNGSVLCIDEPKELITEETASVVKIPEILQRIMYTKSISQVLCTADSLITILDPGIYLEEVL